jgi:methyl-accepting chemotaxis protein
MSEMTGLTEHFKVADRVMLQVCVGLLLFSFALAPVYDTWLESIILGGAIMAGLAALYYFASGTLASRIGFGAGLMFFTALHIQQTNGMIEVHFSVFVLLAILLFYRDWVPIVAAAGTIAVHHLLFYYLQQGGASVWMLPTLENGVWIVAFHASYVVVESSLLIFLSVKLQKEFLQADELMRVTSEIVAQEELNLTIKSSGSTQLLNQFDEFTAAVSGLATKVRTTAESINKDGEELRGATRTMREITDRQSAESIQISSSIQELTELISNVGANANQVASNVELADSRAKTGAAEGAEAQNEIKALANQVTSAKQIIVELNERSSAISGVLDVIRTIADQTNLLALNAAIEAARAGEQGRGFAVVADEVRTLAQRTQDSTQEIDRMIEALQQGSEASVKAISASEVHVESCLGKTEKSQEMMAQIREDVAGLMHLSQNIADQTNEQITAVENISSWSGRLAADSKEAVVRSGSVASSGEMLQRLASDLLSESARFKTG